MMFSVVLCTYNRSALVTRASDSVLSQTWKDFELLIVDDGSTDDTQQVLAKIDDPRVTVLGRPNGGLSVARNTGIGAASGRFVIFLDDDDSVHPQWLARLAQAVEPSTGMVSCTSEILAEDQTRVRVLDARPHDVFPHVKGVFVAGSFAIDRDVLDSIGGYADAVQVSHQTELLLRALPELESRSLTCTLVDEPLLRITRREADERPSRHPTRLFEGACYFLDNHHQVLSKNRPVLADYYAIAGVNAAKIGRPRDAKRYLLKAALTHPRNPTHLGRFGMSMVPGLAKRAWDSDE